MHKSDILDRFLRAMIALAFTGAVIYGFLIDKVSAEAFIGFVGMVLVYYFQVQRQSQRERAADQPNGTNGPATPEPQPPK